MPLPTIDQLRADSAVASGLRNALAPIGSRDELQRLPDRFEERLARDYPLVGRESIAGTAVHYLATDWNGLPAGACVFERESDQAVVDFVLADVGWDLSSGRLRPSRLPARADGTAAVPPHATVAVRARVHATTKGGANDTEAILRSVGSLTLDVIGSLAWATPAGPFVSAGISIFQALLGGAFGAPGPSLIQQITQLSEQVVSNITHFIEEKELHRAFRAVTVFSEWLQVISTELDKQSAETFRFHMTEPGGILAQLNDQLGPNVENNLFYLVTTLSGDPDLNDGGAYADAHRRTMAERKMRLYFFALSLYFTAIRLKIAMVAKLFAFGYDEHGRPLDRTDPKSRNPDNTFELFLRELAKYRDLTPRTIAAVRKRRLAQISMRDAGCEVAYSSEWKPVDRRGEWASQMNPHDALYRGPKNDQLVRDRQDGPTPDAFEWGEDERDSRGRSHGGRYVYFHAWMRTEIVDQGVDDGANARDFVLHNGDWGRYAYEQNTARAQALMAAYRDCVAAGLDAWLRVPQTLGETVEKIQRLWVPKLPAHFAGPGALFIEGWTRGADPGSLWTNPLVQVRYRLSVTTTAGIASDVSDGTTSSTWTAPNGRCAPKIVGLPPFAADPAQPSFDFIDVLRLHREFRLEQPDGSYRTLAPVVVASFSRDEQGAFPAAHVDTMSASREERSISET